MQCCALAHLSLPEPHEPAFRVLDVDAKAVAMFTPEALSSEFGQRFGFALRGKAKALAGVVHVLLAGYTEKRGERSQDFLRALACWRWEHAKGVIKVPAGLSESTLSFFGGFPLWSGY